MSQQKQGRNTHPPLFFFLAFISLAVTVGAKPGNEKKWAIHQSLHELEVDDLKKEAFSILNNKCNSCHRKQNPFMIFTEKNMTKRVTKINKQVFELKRMPKQNGTPLTQEEYAILKSWIKIQ